MVVVQYRKVCTFINARVFVHITIRTHQYTKLIKIHLYKIKPLAYFTTCIHNLYLCHAHSLPSLKHLGRAWQKLGRTWHWRDIFSKQVVALFHHLGSQYYFYLTLRLWHALTYQGFCIVMADLCKFP